MCPNCSNAMKVDGRRSVITCDNKYCITKFIKPLAKLTFAEIESEKYNTIIAKKIRRHLSVQI